ncbi:MAG: ATP-binding protein [Candidatus Sedimenticola sp. PURPLELP]
MPLQLESLVRAQRTSRLLLAVLAVSIGLVLWQVARLSEEAALSDLHERSSTQLSFYVANLQGQLQKFEFLPELLATNKAFVNLLKYPGDRVQAESLNRYLETINRIADASDTYLMDTRGLTIAASNWQSERPFIGRNFSYRPYFKEAMEGRLGRYFALGTTSKKRGYYFAYPVRSEGSILGAVVIKINMAPIEEKWSRSEDEFIVTDPDGVVFITTNKSWRYKTLTTLSPEVTGRIRESRRYANADLMPLGEIAGEIDQGRIILVSDPVRASYLALEQAMPEAGWKVHILTNTAPVAARVTWSVLTAIVVIGIAVLSVMFLMQRRKRLEERERFERQAKKSLELNEARIRAILEGAQAGVVTMNDQGIIEFANSRAQELFGYDQGELSGRLFMECFAENDQLSAERTLRASESGVAVTEMDARNKNGHLFPVELSVGSLKLRDGRKRIATIHDISFAKRQEAELRQAHDLLEVRVSERTRDLSESNIRLTREIEEHRQTEEALRQAQDELIQAAKMAVLGQMSTGISHELNQPLAAIRSYADNARALLDHGRKEDACWNLTQISELTERMATISSQLKVFSRKTKGQLVSVSLTAAIDHSLRILASRIKESQAEIIQHIPENELFVMADMVQLEQVLINLIGNALQAVEQQDERRVELEAISYDEEVVITIRDTGSGIAPDHLPRIFDPFFTTKDEGSGLGLGLSISHRIVESMSGELLANNHMDGGAIFTLSMPKGDAPEEKVG